MTSPTDRDEPRRSETPRPRSADGVRHRRRRRPRRVSITTLLGADAAVRHRLDVDAR